MMVATLITASEPARPMPIGRILRAYALEAKYETLGVLRTPALALPFLAIPTAIYFLFGVLMVGGDGTQSEWGPQIVNMLFSGFATVGVMMPGIFCPSASIPLEREGGVLELKRAQPMPPGANLIGKVVSSTVVAALAVSGVFALAIAADTTLLSPGQLTIMWFAMVIGSIPFCAIGFFIGTIASGSSAPAYGNLIFLPMMWLSGLFIPLPEFLQPWTVIWPAFHLNQLALGLANVEPFVFVPAELAGGVLVGVTVLFGGLALRRLARKG